MRSRTLRFEAYCRKGETNALDHFCDSADLMAFGVGKRLYDGGLRSYPARHRHHRPSRPAYSGTKSAVTMWTVAKR